MENECKKYLSMGPLNFIILSYDLTGGARAPWIRAWIRSYIISKDVVRKLFNPEMYILFAYDVIELVL